jgi:hypothetical protein
VFGAVLADDKAAMGVKGLRSFTGHRGRGAGRGDGDEVAHEILDIYIRMIFDSSEITNSLIGLNRGLRQGCTNVVVEVNRPSIGQF